MLLQQRANLADISGYDSKLPSFLSTEGPHIGFDDFWK